MAIYIVNRNTDSNGNHEVHRVATCNRLPKPENQRRLGDFPTCHGAVREAKKHYSKVDGCFYCSSDCHKR